MVMFDHRPALIANPPTCLLDAPAPATTGPVNLSGPPIVIIAPPIGHSQSPAPPPAPPSPLRGEQNEPARELPDSPSAAGKLSGYTSERGAVGRRLAGRILKPGFAGRSDGRDPSRPQAALRAGRSDRASARARPTIVSNSDPGQARDGRHRGQIEYVLAIVHLPPTAGKIEAPLTFRLAMTDICIKYQISDRGGLSNGHLLDMETAQDILAGSVLFSHKTFTNDLLVSFGSSECRPRGSRWTRHSRSGPRPTPRRRLPNTPTMFRYRELMGSLDYLATKVRSDIDFSVGVLCPYCTNTMKCMAR
jgi:hypothetical protein